MDSLSSIMVVKALDGLSTRAVATAENIANASTPGYRPLRVTFEQALKAAASSGPDAIRALTPEISRETGGAPTELRVDLELVEATATAGRYGALIDLLGRQMQLHSLAVSGGRR